MRLYFMRHGQSEANAKDEHCGWAPVHLTEKGIEEVKKTGEKLKTIQFDACFSSDLVRVRETRYYAMGDIPVTEMTELREMNVGTLMGHTPAQMLEMEGETYRRRKAVRDFRPYGGEDMDSLYSRVATFMSLMEKKPYSDMKNILVFSSEGPIAMALDYVIGSGHDNMRHLRCDNASLAVFEWNGELWRLKKWSCFEV